MPLGRQALGRRRELHVICTTDDDTIARFETARDADPLPVTRGDLDVPADELFASDLNPHVLSSSLGQHRLPVDGWAANALSSKKHCGAMLADEQLSARVLDLELHRESTGPLVDHASVVHTLSSKRQRIWSPGDF